MTVPADFAIGVPIIGVDRISGTLRSVGAKLRGFQAGLSAMGAGIQRISVPILGIGVAAAKVNLDYERALGRTFAITGATLEQQKQLRGVARDLAGVLPVGPAAATRTMETLASKGADALEVMRMLPAAIQLGLGGRIGPEGGAAALDDALDAFRLPSTQASRVADVLARASTFGGSTLDQFVSSLKTVAPTAMAAGHGLEETAADLAILQEKLGIDNAASQMVVGIKALAKESRRAPALLDPVTKRLVSMSEAAALLERRGFGGRDALAQLGRSGPAFAALIGMGSAELERMNAALLRAPGAAELAKAATTGLEGSMLKLRKSVEGVLLSLGESGLNSMLEKTASRLSSVVDSFAKLPKSVREGTIGLGGMTVAMAALLRVGQMIGGLNFVKGAVFAGFVALGEIAGDFLVDLADSDGSVPDALRLARAREQRVRRNDSARRAVPWPAAGTGAIPPIAASSLASLGLPVVAQSKIRLEIVGLPGGGHRVRSTGNLDVDVDLGFRAPGSSP